MFTLFWPLNIKTAFIDDSNRHHIPQKNPGYLIFNISVNTLTPQRLSFQKRRQFGVFHRQTGVYPPYEHLSTPLNTSLQYPLCHPFQLMRRPPPPDYRSKLFASLKNASQARRFIRRERTPKRITLSPFA